MAGIHSLTLRNTDANYASTADDDSTIRRVLVDIERLMAMLDNKAEPNPYAVATNLINASPYEARTAPSFYCPSSSTTITSVTLGDDNHRLIEHLRHRVARLEHERNVLLTSYQLLIKLLK